MALRVAGIKTICILGTEVNANTRKRIAVGVWCRGARRTILGTTSLRGRIVSAISAETITIAVKRSSSAQAIAVGSTVNTSSRRDIALRLVGFETTITNAIRILSASLARLISHTVVTSSRSGTAVIVSRCGGRATHVGRNTNTRIANDISTHGRRSIIANTVSVVSTGSATTIFHAVLVGRTSGVRCTSGNTDVGLANGRATQITTPGSGSGTVSI